MAKNESDGAGKQLTVDGDVLKRVVGLRDGWQWLKTRQNTCKNLIMGGENSQKSAKGLKNVL